MIAEVKLSGITGKDVRAIAAVLSQHRDAIPTYNHSGTVAAHWAPMVNAEGPALFGLVTPQVPPQVAAAVLNAVRWEGQES